MKKTSHILPSNIQADIAECNDHLLLALDLLTPSDRNRTGLEQVIFELVLMDAKKTPANNTFDLAKYN